MDRSQQPMRDHRSGTVLVLVAGVCALLAGLALALLLRMRDDAAESALVVHDAQARMMLAAACCYVLEAGRLGLDQRAGGAAGATHDEGFGWIDVRDGSLGPKARRDDPAAYPIGWVARCPMAAWQRPPFAVRLTVAANPMNDDPTAADFAMPFLRHADPQPDAIDFAGFARGDPRPRPETLGLAWFRVRRTDAARFTLTCGAGSTLGYRDWADVVADGAVETFGSPSLFAALQADEVRLWYRIEWSAAVGGATYQCIDNEAGPDHHQWRPFNPIHEWWPNGHQSQPHARNLVGTLRWIQRLREQPARDDW